jgi:hypothetical protein
LEDVYGDLKNVGEVETVMTVAEDLTVVECMKGKEAKGRNDVKNYAKEGKQERCVIVRGYN